MMTSEDVSISMTDLDENKDQEEFEEIFINSVLNLNYDQFVQCLEKKKREETEEAFSVTIQDVFGYVCSQPGAMKLIKVCKEKYGADVNKKDENGIDPIHWATDSKDVENLKVLIESTIESTIDSTIDGTIDGTTDSTIVTNIESTIDLNTLWEGITPISYLCLMIDDKNYLKISECIKYLITKKADLNISDPCKRTPISLLIQSDLSGEKTAELLKYIFDAYKGDKKIDVNQTDKEKCSLLFYAVQNKKTEVILQLLQKHSAYIGTKNKNHEIAIKDIPPEILEKYFDTCVDLKVDKDDMITIDLACLVPLKARKSVVQNDEKKKVLNERNCEEMMPIEYIANTRELRYLLKHPVIIAFIFLKWQKIRNLFYINFAIFSAYFISLTAYIMCCYLKNSNTLLHDIIYYTLSIFVTYVLFRELMQCLLSPISYLKTFANYVELCLVGLTMTILFVPDLPESSKRIVATVSILLAGTEFTFLFGAMPYLSISVHMAMLKAVTSNFLKILSLYSIYILAFAFSFYTLFHENNEDAGDTTNKSAGDSSEFKMFSKPGSAIMKTIVMMTGEFEAGDFDYSPMSYIVLVLFIFLIAIVMFNLLNGLAVSDTQTIQMEAELIDLKERTHLLSNYEKLVIIPNSTFECFKHLILKLGFLKKSTSLFPHAIPHHKIQFVTNTMGLLVPSKKRKDEKSSTQVVEVEKSEAIKVDAIVIKYSNYVIEKKIKEEQEGKERYDANERMKNIEMTLKKILEGMKPNLSSISSKTAPK